MQADFVNTIQHDEEMKVDFVNVDCSK